MEKGVWVVNDVKGRMADAPHNKRAGDTPPNPLPPRGHRARNPALEGGPP
jgi:hypothetical protein